MEDKFNIGSNGRKAQYFSDGRQPNLFGKWKMTSIFSKWKITQLFGQMEDNLGTAQPQLVFASVKKCPKQSPFEIAQYPKVENLFVCPLCLPKACGKGYFENCTSVGQTEQYCTLAHMAT